MIQNLDGASNNANRGNEQSTGEHLIAKEK
jgi:hypothetical protein